MIEMAGDTSWLEIVPGMDHFNWVMPYADGFSQVMELALTFMAEHFPAT